MTYDCPKGHASSDADYCSECGIKIQGSSAPTAAAPATTPALCPSCATPRLPGARFCEVCRFDFTDPTSTSTSLAAMSAPGREAGTPPPPASMRLASVAPAATPLAFAEDTDAPFYGKNAWAVVTAERSLVAPDNAAAFPADEIPRSYPLDFPENLVGRHSARAGLHPEVPVNDPSVSSRHLKLCRRSGRIVLVDVGSTNGTIVNGSPVRSGVEVPLRPGDTIDLGAWTRIVLEAR